jgi:hypothetical protein
MEMTEDPLAARIDEIDLAAPYVSRLPSLGSARIKGSWRNATR